MTNKRTISAIATLLCGVALAYCSSAMAWSYHSLNHGYTLSLPDDWVQTPQEVLAANLSDLATRQKPRGQFDVVFQPHRDAAGIHDPYIIIEAIPYETWGYDQQVTDQVIHQIVQVNTGLDPLNPFQPEGAVMEGGGEVESLEGVLGFDAANRRFTWDSTLTLPEIGLVRMRQWGFFGKEGLVLITLHERGAGSDRLREMARAVAGSFKFEAGREYQPAFTLADAVDMGRQLFAAPNLGLVATLACVGTALLFAMICFLTGRRAPSYQQYSVDRD